jgi:hypothetical protein
VIEANVNVLGAVPGFKAPYPVWKAAAVKALQKRHERAAIFTRESIWTRAYIMRLDPAKTAELAAREYDSTHPPSWIKRRR